MAEVVHKQIRPMMSPRTLQHYSLYAVSDLLSYLNTIDLSPEFPWFHPEQNPFLAFSPIVLEEILEYCRGFSGAIRKEIFQILLCKPLKKIDLRHFMIREQEVLDVLKMIKATQSDLTWFETHISNEDDGIILWLSIPSALNYLKDYIRSLASLTHLNIIGSSDDEMLEIIGDSCPNLIDLFIDTEEITSQGLKRLCLNSRNPQGPKRCQKLQWLYLRGYDDDHLMTGIETVLLNMPQLRLLDWSPVALGKVVERLFIDSNGTFTTNLCKLRYHGCFPFSCLPSLIAKSCPYLKTLFIKNAANEELQRFQCMDNLRAVSIKRRKESADFKDGIAPFLQRTGQRLEELTLKHFEEIDFNVINDCCPNLKRLTCYTSGLLSGRVTAAPVFKQMEKMQLNSSFGKGLNPLDCIHLLSSCFKLHSLSISCCQDLNKEHLEMILLRNPLINLHHVDIISSTLHLWGTDCTTLHM